MSIEKDIQELTAAVKALTAVMKQPTVAVSAPTVTITEPVAAQAPVRPFYWHNPTVAVFGVEDEPGAFRTSLECDPEVKEITEQEYLRLKEAAAPVVQIPEAVTYEALRDVFQQLVEKKTATPLKAILEKLGVKRAPELKPEQFAEAMALAQEAMQ